MNFKECLNNYIKEYNISVKTLASQLNISEATMSRYRTGKNIPIKNSKFVKKLSKIIYDYITSTQIITVKIYLRVIKYMIHLTNTAKMRVT